jgi:hypothetical protein
MNIRFIRKLKNHKDGSETWLIDYDKKLEKIVKNYYNMKRVSKKAIEKFILCELRNYLNIKNKL